MSKLFNAQFCRMIKTKEFYICLATCFVVSIAAMINFSLNAPKDPSTSLDKYFFNFLPFFSVFTAIFISLFIGTEYSDGAIRNKVITGATRKDIYFANTCLGMLASFIFTLAQIIGAFMAGVTLFGFFDMSIGSVFILIFLIVLSNIVLSAIFTALSMTFSNKATSAVLTMLLFLGLLVFGSMIYNKLLEPELTSGIVIISGAPQMTELEPNPRYIMGTARKIHEFLLDFLPTGQQIQVADLNVLNPVRIVICSIFLLITTVLGGSLAFNKKDLK